MQWTDEQLRALETRGTNILLSAAAGSGKTTVLVERILRLILEDGADVDRMLVVTFTRAAASDMRAKLSRRLTERAAQGEARCRDQLLKLERASISTLHAFCADFLRMNFESAGVDPAFRILDDAVNGRLLEEALDEALEEAYAQGGEALQILDYGRGPAGVRAAVELLFARMEERPDPEIWLNDAARCDDAAISAWFSELVAAARRAIQTALIQLRQALEVPGCPPHYANAIRKDMDALAGLLSLDEYDPLWRALSDFSPARAAGGKRGDADPDATEAVKRLRESAKRTLGEVRMRAMPAQTAREDALRLAPQIATLARIALRVSELYEVKKDEQSGLTYADLEHRTLHALKRPETARSVRERFDYIFVDEYQDTSDLQDTLIRAICRPDNLFMVGDVKQSIYRFRLAEPRLFLEKYDAYMAGKGGCLLPLTMNFRSRRGILDFVNRVFERVMTGGDAEICYDELARLNPGNPDDELSMPCVDIHLIDAAAEPETAEPDEDSTSEVVAELKSVERECVLIAGEIRRMMAEDPTLKFRDFAILTRSKAGAFDAMMPVLLAQGIPAYADGAMGYFDTVEIAWTLSMLRLIANRRSDVELIGILYSPVVGLTPDELAQIRIASRNMPYIDAALAYAESGKDDLSTRLQAFFERLENWRLKAGSLGLGEFVRLVLDESGFYTYAGALPGGAQRQANLDQLVVSACNFDQQISGSLTRFLQYTEHLRQKGDGDVAHLLSENDNVVRMMTIHKSKGLEFKVVFGAQLARRYRVEKSNAPLVAHRDLGIGMNYVDPELRTRRMTLPQVAIMERQKREDAAEEMRILYVLLTRAQERLILTGSVRGADQSMKRWQALAETPFAANCHLDLVMAARCGAETAGLPVYSTLAVHPASDMRIEALSQGETKAKTLFEQIMASPENYADEELERQMAWEYPAPLSARKPLKLTASGLLRELEGPCETVTLLERPQFMMEDARRMTGVERGTAYHRAMQMLRLEALQGLSGRTLAAAIGRQLDDLANRRILTDAQRDAVSAFALARFLDGEVGLRLRAASEIRREWPFNVLLRISEALTPEEAGSFADEEILVQGTVDCCFIEQDAWILLDYKTDRGDDMEALRAHYRKQLHLYALALERITGIPVRQRLLCLISANAVLEV